MFNALESAFGVQPQGLLFQDVWFNTMGLVVACTFTPTPPDTSFTVLHDALSKVQQWLGAGDEALDPLSDGIPPPWTPATPQEQQFAEEIQRRCLQMVHIVRMC